LQAREPMDNTSRSRQDASAHVLGTIARKRAGELLPARDIKRLIEDFVAGRVPDYQMSAWLATVACIGMEIEETEALTRAYVAGGMSVDLGGVGKRVIDKHSTGGVGDKVSLVVTPIVAACGVAVAKMSGRGLGHAGGTIDKLESIRGLRLDLAAAEVRALVNELGMVITGQSAELAPGDKATYALRDVTGTVESVPLIAASIISKKVAVGAHGLLLDVKTGAGALIQDHAMAVHLAQTMVDLATRFGLDCRAVLSDMSQPLGFAVGNALEVKEALAALRGDSIPGFTELCRVLSRLMLQLALPDLSDAEADQQVSVAVSSGAAHEKFLQWARAQGADAAQLANPDLLPTAPRREFIRADRTGWVESIDPRAIGNAALRVGAGRLVQGAPIDHSAGIVLQRRVGDAVAAGDCLAEIHYDEGDITSAKNLTASAFTLGISQVCVPPVVHQVFGAASRLQR